MIPMKRCIYQKKKKVIVGLLENIDEELNTSIDEISQDVLVSYLEVLLNYSNRFINGNLLLKNGQS
jgi:hypothetical protein